MRNYRRWLVVAASCAFIGQAGAQVPALINYQGRLLSGTSLVNGSVSMGLALYTNAVGGVKIYEDTGTVTVSDGLYSTYLGDGTSTGVLTDALGNSPLYLEVGVNGSALAPRERIAAVAYALMADGVKSGGVTSAMLSGGSVTSLQLAVAAVQSTNISPGAVGAPQLAGNAVGSAAIIDGSIAAADLSDQAAWKLAGNAGTTGGVQFVGTSDAQPMDFRANGARALRLDASNGAPNVIGGYSGNAVSNGVVGAAIGGGGTNALANRVTDQFGSIAGGMGNMAGDNAGAATDAVAAAVGGGSGNKAGGAFATVAGGFNNAGSNMFTTISGGQNNTAAGLASAVGGGQANSAQGLDNVISGGQNCLIQTGADYAVVGGGQNHVINSNALYATVSGGYSNNIQYGSARSSIGGGYENRISKLAEYATIAGGQQNTIDIDADGASIGGGLQNTINAGQGAGLYGSTVAGGRNNTESGTDDAIGGGQYNTIGSALQGVIGGGFSNTIQDLADYGTIAGGIQNTILNSKFFGTIGGGRTNTVGASYATVPGGEGNVAQGIDSFAAGKSARALHDGSFVWADGSGTTNAASTNVNSWTVRCAGGARFLTATTNVGVQLPPGGNAWASMSDRNVKENFTPVDSLSVLEKVAGMPVTTWNLKTQDPSIRHIGPMAQDFMATFRVGESDRYIGVSDADGVALAAIQGLYQLVQEKDAALREQKTEIEALKREMEAIRSRMPPSP